MLLIVEDDIIGGICHDINRYARANNKYMNDYVKNKESSYLKTWGVNKLCEWAMSQKLPVNDFKLIEDISEFNEDFIKSYNDERDEGYFLEVDVQYPENLYILHIDLPFLPERIKIEKVENLVANLHDKNECVIHIRNLKQALNHGLALKKMHRTIKFNQKDWLKPYVDMYTDLRKRTDIEKYILKN